jgi:hypothetical protein
MSNYEKFENELRKNYESLFVNNIEYRYAANHSTPAELAGRMTNSLFNGTANKDGKGIKLTCKALGIKHTYKAIQEYLRYSESVELGLSLEEMTA